jgi:ubiquinone/menaquinone biosynthesis C-methylase UbiE
MSKTNKKLQDEWLHWENRYDYLVKSKDRYLAWLESEVSYITGWIHRATGKRPNARDKVLQIGVGPVDVIHFWDSNEKHGIDPLAEEYREKYGDFQTQGVNYVVGVGENLPYEVDYFDIVVIRNALDHVYDPSKVLREIRRVLKTGGALYIWMYLYDWRYSLAYRTTNALTKMFEQEPWAFTWGRINKLLKSEGFELLYPAREKRPDVYRRWFMKVLTRIHFFRNPEGFICVAVPVK